MKKYYYCIFYAKLSVFSDSIIIEIDYSSKSYKIVLVLAYCRYRHRANVLSTQGNQHKPKGALADNVTGISCDQHRQGDGPVMGHVSFII